MTSDVPTESISMINPPLHIPHWFHHGFSWGWEFRQLFIIVVSISSDAS